MKPIEVYDMCEYLFKLCGIGIMCFVVPFFFVSLLWYISAYICFPLLIAIFIATTIVQGFCIKKTIGWILLGNNKKSSIFAKK